jgi:hypothetical protein
MIAQARALRVLTNFRCLGRQEATVENFATRQPPPSGSNLAERPQVNFVGVGVRRRAPRNLANRRGAV